MQTAITTIIGMVRTSRHKDRMDYMLEPMQAMSQICSLAFLPIGTKLHIDSNILQTHQPSLSQGLTRYISGDGKDDLYYLCNVFIQYVNWYGQTSDTDPISVACRESGLFDLMLKLAKIGLDRLIQTYRTSDKPTVLHTLGIYRMILTNPNLFMTGTESGSSVNNSSSNSNNASHNNGSKNTRVSATRARISGINNMTNSMTNSTDSESSNHRDVPIPSETAMETYKQVLETLPGGFSSEAAGIERRPRKPIYMQGDLQVIHGLLTLMTQHSDNQVAITSYLQAIDNMMKPRHEPIRRWVMNSVGL